jgi:hypothetical protein
MTAQNTGGAHNDCHTRSLRAMEQGLLMWRLGPLTLFDKAHPTGHYILDLTNPSHEQVRTSAAYLQLGLRSNHRDVTTWLFRPRFVLKSRQLLRWLVG